MQQLTEPRLVWHESSAIWQVIAGELVVQSGDPLSDDAVALRRRAVRGAHDALQLLRAEKLDDAGHALIGCTLALALAARAEAETTDPIENYASELAAAVSWRAARPSEEELERLATGLGIDNPDPGRPTLWDLAIDTGAYAAGLSASITRRRQRRDILSR